MDPKALSRLTQSWPGVTSDVKWGNDLIFSVGGKMFCGQASTARSRAS